MLLVHELGEFLDWKDSVFGGVVSKGVVPAGCAPGLFFSIRLQQKSYVYMHSALQYCIL